MTDRRKNEQPAAPEIIAEAKLNSLKFRDEDNEEMQKEVLLAMAQQINKKYGKTLEGGGTGMIGSSAGIATLEAGGRSQKADSVQELTPEQAWLGEFKTRFYALPQLHKGIEWADVEKSLMADSESMVKLQALDAKGHAMNVFGEENGEFIFASGWSDHNEVSADHKNITYDLDGQHLAEKAGYTPNGNAVDIAKLIGVDLADPKFNEQLRKAIAINGWAWLKTDTDTRKGGCAFFGNGYGIFRDRAHARDGYGSFRAALRVKKV